MKVIRRTNSCGGRCHLQKKHLSISSSTSNEFVYFYNDDYKVKLPDNHKFPMEKYSYVRQSLQQQVDGNKDVIFQRSPLASFDELTSTHCPKYVKRFLDGDLTPKELRAIGFPWTKQGVNRSLSSVGGTLAATRLVMDKQRQDPNDQRKVSAQLAGGTHHAFYDRGEGFCSFSDIAISANIALDEYQDVFNAAGSGDEPGRVLIIDLDVHQGNGNAVLFQNNPLVYTFNMHCSGNIFSARQESDCDIDLPNGTSGEEYLDVLSEWLPRLFYGLKPQLVFFQAGVDILQHDRLGKLHLSRQDVRTRNSLVYQAAISANVPLVVTMGGGYPKDINPISDSFREVIGAHTDVYSQIIDEYSNM